MVGTTQNENKIGDNGILKVFAFKVLNIGMYIFCRTLNVSLIPKKYSLISAFIFDFCELFFNDKKGPFDSMAHFPFLFHWTRRDLITELKKCNTVLIVLYVLK